MKAFGRKRQVYTIRNFIDHFGLSGASDIKVKLKPARTGQMKIIGYDIPDGFRGKFFNDIPLRISAMPATGYQFSHWTDGATTYQTPEIEIILKKDTTFTAHFKEACDTDIQR
jgi:uncharacterized repeat protein (TIGR02543 family)